MPLTAYGEQKTLDVRWGETTSAPADDYLGLITAGQWGTFLVFASTSALSGTYCVGSAFSSTNRHIYKCTTAGTTGSSEPSWNQTAGATTTDGTAVWTECTNLFLAGTFTAAEVSGNNYARVSVTNNGTNWPVSTGSAPATKVSGAAFSWPATTGSWGYIVAVLDYDASSNGNCWAYALLNVAFPLTVTGMTMSIPSGDFSFTQA